MARDLTTVAAMAVQRISEMHGQQLPDWNAKTPSMLNGRPATANILFGECLGKRGRHRGLWIRIVFFVKYFLLNIIRK